MKKLAILVLALTALFLFACTDYVSQIEDDRDEWRLAQKEKAVSSSSTLNTSSAAKSDRGASVCSVSDGVKIVYPAGGETFKVDDEITVVFGTAIEDSYRIIFKNGSSDAGMDLLENAIDVKTDGKTCNEVMVKLSADRGVEATSTGIIRVAPYSRQNKGSNSSTFSVVDENAKSSNGSYDCTVTDGVKVVYPAGGETFKVGDEITVVFGTAIEDIGYRIVFKKEVFDQGYDLTNEAYDAVMDGKTCNEVKVKLDAEKGVEETSTGIIRVVPYNKSNKGVNSNTFKVLR